MESTKRSVGIKLYFLCFCLLLQGANSFAQSSGSLSRLFNQVYPIGEDPNINLKSTPSDVKNYETIKFEANPTVRYSFYNNIFERFSNGAPCGFAVYTAYQPQLRMYNDNSVPVKTPSYRLLLGGQYMRRLCDHDLLAVSIESGHYSNGQDGSAFSTKFADGSPQSDSVIAAINNNPKADLSKLLNRRSGEFSTDLTELILNYRFNKLDSNTNIPSQIISIKGGATLL
jgi:hypothetical protein